MRMIRQTYTTPHAVTEFWEKKKKFSRVKSQHLCLPKYFRFSPYENFDSPLSFWSWRHNGI